MFNFCEIGKIECSHCGLSENELHCGKVSGKINNIDQMIVKKIDCPGIKINCSSGKAANKKYDHVSDKRRHVCVNDIDFELFYFKQTRSK